MPKNVGIGCLVVLFAMLCACQEFSQPIDKHQNAFRCGNEGESVEGRALFLAKCASCHNPFKAATGPALQGILIGRDTNFLYQFLTNRKLFKQDQMIKDRIHLYRAHCSEFPNITREAADLLEKEFHGRRYP